MAKQRGLMANLKEVKSSEVSSCPKFESPWMGLHPGLLAAKLTWAFVVDVELILQCA